jgi:hypothetical protein
MYYEEQRLKAEEEKMLVREAEEKVRRETPGTWEHQTVVQRRRTDVLERQMLGVRPLRHGHRHDRRQVFCSV